MSLSGRIRPNSEAAQWVVDEVKQLESLLSASQSREDEFQRIASNATFDLQSVRKDLFQAQQENAELRRLLESKVPEGWQLVPKEPTYQQCAQALVACPVFDLSINAIPAMYRAILAHAPQPPKEPKQ